MARPLIAELAPSIVCAPGYIIRVTAVNPTTGVVDTGVVISDVALQVNSATAIEEGPPLKLSPPVASFGSTSGAEAPGLTRG